jgi:arginine-tRNA-protein transferase
MSAKEGEHQFLLFQSAGERCPYLPGREWVTHVFQTQAIAPGVYESILNRGFRRSGTLFYQNHCPDCQECLPIRIDARRFCASRSQRRVLKKNHDVTVRITPDNFCHDDFELYRTYCIERHPSHPVPAKEDYMRFLIDSPVPTNIMRYMIGERQVGLGWIDMLTHSLSSVYFSFDPGYSSRSLGTFSILQQVELCRLLGKHWLQLGFWVKDCQKMSYKSHFKPCHVLVDGQWRRLS